MSHGNTMEEAVQKAIGEIGNSEVEVKKHEEVEVKGFWRKVKKLIGV
jgi:hypothetical protein